MTPTPAPGLAFVRRVSTEDDAYVLEAARSQRVPLLSLDRQLLRAAAAKDIPNVEVSA